MQYFICKILNIPRKFFISVHLPWERTLERSEEESKHIRNGRCKGGESGDICPEFCDAEAPEARVENRLLVVEFAFYYLA